METTLKVVCIVQNNVATPDLGLRHTFLPNQNDFIEKYLYKYDKGKDSIKCFFPEGNNNYLIINKNSARLVDKVIETDDWDIILVSDKLLIDNYSECLFTESTLFMHHSIPHDSVTKLKEREKYKKIKSGAHEPQDFGYSRLYQLTEAWTLGEDQKFIVDIQKYDAALQHIINWFNVNDELEAKLELLHNCLLPSNAPKLEEFDSKFNILKENYKEDYKLFFSSIDGKTDDDVFNAKYIDTVKQLRIVLLGS
jgi:hypothetical protein